MANSLVVFTRYIPWHCIPGPTSHKMGGCEALHMRTRPTASRSKVIDYRSLAAPSDTQRTWRMLESEEPWKDKRKRNYPSYCASRSAWGTCWTSSGWSGCGSHTRLASSLKSCGFLTTKPLPSCSLRRLLRHLHATSRNTVWFAYLSHLWTKEDLSPAWRDRVHLFVFLLMAQLLWMPLATYVHHSVLFYIGCGISIWIHSNADPSICNGTWAGPKQAHKNWTQFHQVCATIE